MKKTPRYRIIKSYNSDGGAHFYLQKNIFGIWIGCRWYDSSYGTSSWILEIVENCVAKKLDPEENKKKVDEVVKVYD